MEQRKFQILLSFALMLMSETAMSNDCDSFVWSDNPGAYEAQLIRRCSNPYFPSAYQEISIEELEEARSIDNDDYRIAEERFNVIGEELESLGPNTIVGQMNSIRERLDALILFSLGTGGRANETALKATQLREALIQDIRTGIENDQEALARLEEAERFHAENEKVFHIPIVAQILRERSPVDSEHTIPTILSESPAAIAIIMNRLSNDVRPVIELEALTLMREVLNSGFIDPQLEEKMIAVQGEI